MNRRPTTVFAAIRDTLRSNRIAKQKQRVIDAVKVQARATSDKEFHRIMSDFYTQRVAAIDPHNDWWEFAENKQKEQDHVEEHQSHGARSEEAAAVVAAEQARYVQLLNAYSDAGEGGAS